MQFHPEVRADIVRSWLRKDPSQPKRYGFDADALLAEIDARAVESRASAAALLDAFLEQAGIGGA